MVLFFGDPSKRGFWQEQRQRAAIITERKGGNAAAVMGGQKLYGAVLKDVAEDGSEVKLLGCRIAWRGSCEALVVRQKG